jgi:transposase-like protein|tara:strand:- start:404 stop:682 length:279 start_codon:yes stop_codon:yes gene_type:complete
MPRKRYSDEEIITKLRQAEVLISQGKSINEASRAIGVVSTTFSKWRAKYGGMQVNQVKAMKDLHKENERLKRIVADQALDISMLKEISKGNF